VTNYYEDQVEDLRIARIIHALIKERKMKRSIQIEGPNLDVMLDISKFATPNVQKEFIHLDKLADGTWRLLMNVNTDSGRLDMQQVENMRVIRGH
jgi:hypothetical protein